MIAVDNVTDVLAAVLPLLTAFCGWAAARLTRSRKEEKALRDGVKGLLRAKVIDLGLHYIDEKAVPPYGVETLRSCYDPYMALGVGDPHHAPLRNPAGAFRRELREETWKNSGKTWPPCSRSRPS